MSKQDNHHQHHHDDNNVVARQLENIRSILCVAIFVVAVMIIPNQQSLFHFEMDSAVYKKNNNNNSLSSNNGKEAMETNSTDYDYNYSDRSDQHNNNNNNNNTQSKAHHQQQKKEQNQNPNDPSKQYQLNDNIDNNINDNIKPLLNIVLLYADDWRHDSLGVASKGLVHTPFLDYLSTQGVRFTHNCVTTSTCWISRATLYTGQYLSRHKSSMPRYPIFYNDWNTSSYPMLLKNYKNYYIGHVGKWHFRDYASKIAPTFDYQKMYYGQHWYKVENNDDDDNNNNNNPPTSRIHTTKRNEQDAMEFLKTRPQNVPFCLTVAFFTPHAQANDPRQYLPQPLSMKLYNTTTIPRAYNTYPEYRPPFFHKTKNAAFKRYDQRFDTESLYQTMMKNYYRLISEIDSSSEVIYNELKRQGILNKTLFIFTTDNGYFHAEHGLADKWFPYQESIRVPLIIQDPRMPRSKKGTTNSDFTLNIDLAPTIVGAANIPKHLYENSMQGRDIAELYLIEKDNSLATNVSSWRQSFYYEHPTHIDPDMIPESQALVRKDYKYINWPTMNNREQLFDLINDPLEEHDLLLQLSPQNNQITTTTTSTTNSSLVHHIQNLLQEMKDEFKVLQQAAK